MQCSQRRKLGQRLKFACKQIVHLRESCTQLQSYHGFDSGFTSPCSTHGIVDSDPNHEQLLRKLKSNPCQFLFSVAMPSKMRKPAAAAVKRPAAAMKGRGPTWQSINHLGQTWAEFVDHLKEEYKDYKAREESFKEGSIFSLCFGYWQDVLP